MSDAPSTIAAAVRGADRAFRVIDGGAPPPTATAPGGCPVIALGHREGVFHFLDVAGQKRALSAQKLGARDDLLSLFGGDDTWLRAEHPKRVQRQGADGEPGEWVTVDFVIKSAAAALQRACFAAGIFGDHLLFRRSGVWAGPSGAPVVHCGDKVLFEGEWRPPGARYGNQFWVAGAPTPRPDMLGCASAVATDLQDRLARLWDWAEPGAPIAVLGLLGSAYLGAAIAWRPAAFVFGGTGSGKSALMEVCRGALPTAHYSNDSSKAGIEGAVGGRAVPILVDEASDRADREGARRLADIVLSATGGDGTRGVRGTADGGARSIEIAGTILMFSIRPPPLEPQHLGRFSLIGLRAAAEGADHRVEHAAAASYAREHAAALWGRALSAHERYASGLERFRAALGDAGCAPRERDQNGALLAGWWILTREGVPGPRDAREGVLALGDLVRRGDEARAADRPARAVEHLLSSPVVLKRSTERETVATLLARAWGSDTLQPPEVAREHLALYGIRPVRADEPPGRRGPAPRLSEGDGAWFNPASPLLAALFRETPFDNRRWELDLLDLASAGRARRKIRIGDAVPSNAIWLSRATLLPEETSDDG